MRKIILRVLIFCICLVIFISVLNTKEDISVLNVKSEYISENELSFAIFSDVHIKEKDKSKGEKLNNALGIVNKKVPNIDKYVFTGDYTNSGYIEEYNLFNTICRKHIPSPESRIILMGNHDYWNGLDVTSCQNIFKQELNEELYSCEKIKGFTFISISTQSDYVHGFYSEESLRFAKENIQASVNENKDKPIFIFTHQPPKNTINGSDIWGNGELESAFNEYPQVILFAGHSHFPINDERGIYQENYTVVTAGGIGGIDLEEGMIEGDRPPDNDLASQGLIVKVDKNNKVTISRMDYSTNDEIKKPWIISGLNKDNFRYTKEKQKSKAPTFETFSRAEIVSRSDDNVKISFSQGKDDDMVYSYKVEVYNIEDKTESKQEEFYMFSKFYLGKNMPNKLNVEISKIDTQKEYKVKIFALDCFSNISAKSLNCDIPKQVAE